VHEDVALELAGKEEGQSARIALPHRSGLHGALEVIRDDEQPFARRRLVRARVERHGHRRPFGSQMHVHGDGRPDDQAHEGDHLLGETAQDDTRIGRAFDVRQHLQRRRHRQAPLAHGGQEQLLFAGEVPEDGRRGHPYDLGDIGQRRRCESGGGERLPRRDQDLFTGDSWWAAHR
jgi:hypothetical protein